MYNVYIHFRIIVKWFPGTINLGYRNPGCRYAIIAASVDTKDDLIGCMPK